MRKLRLIKTEDLPTFSSRSWEVPALLTAAALLFFARFFGLNAAPFLNDEPMLQLLLDQSFNHATLPTLGLKGSFGMRYGPTALWAYMPLRLLTSNVNAILAYHALCLGAGLLFFFLAVKRSLGASIAAWALLLATASPYLYFYSRNGWDNTFLILATSLIFYALSLLEESLQPRNFAFLGFVCGLAFNIHLMCVPILAAAAWICFRLLRGRSLQRAWPLVSAGLFAFLIPLVFYVPHLLRLAPAVHSTGPRDFLNTALAVATSAAQFLSTSGMEYFFDTWLENLPEFLGTAPTLLLILDIGILLRIAAVAALFWSAYRITKAEQPLLLVFAVIAAFASLLFFLILAPTPFHPHYSMAVWWLGFLFAAVAIASLHGRFQRVLQVLALLTVVSNVAFVSTAFTRIHQFAGTRGPHYGTEHREVENTLKEICQALGPFDGQIVWFDLSETPGIFTPSLVYFSQHLPECWGKKAFSLFPPSAESVGPLVKLRYRNSTPFDARLEFTLDSVQP